MEQNPEIYLQSAKLVDADGSIRTVDVTPLPTKRTNNYAQAVAAAREANRKAKLQMLIEDKTQMADAILDLFRFDHEQAEFNTWVRETLDALKNNVTRLEHMVDDLMGAPTT